jgi:DNA invertase Pin-like site-specific DNA recombinase
MSDRVVIYARVSTDNQTHDSQLDEVRAYCRRRGWSAVEEITDVASGGKCSREGLDRLMVQVRRGRVGTVVVFRLDRLARSLSHLTVGALLNRAHLIFRETPNADVGVDGQVGQRWWIMLSYGCGSQ